MAKEVVIPWSSNPETNRRNIQQALDDGLLPMGEVDENGKLKVYEITPLMALRVVSQE